MSGTIGERELRTRSDAILRRVEQGESFVVTLDGRPVGDLVPHTRVEMTRTLGEVQERFRMLPPVDPQRWRTDRVRADELLGDDDPAAGSS